MLGWRERRRRTFTGEERGKLLSFLFSDVRRRKVC